MASSEPEASSIVAVGKLLRVLVCNFWAKKFAIIIMLITEIELLCSKIMCHGLISGVALKNKRYIGGSGGTPSQDFMCSEIVQSV